MVETKRSRQMAAAGKENQTSSQGTTSGRGTKRNSEKAATKSNSEAAASTASVGSTPAGPSAKASKADKANKSQPQTSDEPATTSTTTRRSVESKAAENTRNDASKADNSRTGNRNSTTTSKQRGFNGLNQEVDRILGCTEHEGELVFLIKWKHSDDAPQVVPAKIANIKYPQKVIEFYEQRIVWDDPL